MCQELGFQVPPNQPKIEKVTMTSSIFDMTSLSNIFNGFFLLLSNLIVGPSFMSISSEFMISFFYKRFTTNPEIRKSIVWILCNIWRLGRVRDYKFCTNVSNKMLLNAAKCQGWNFYCFWVIKWKDTGERVKLPFPPPLSAPRLGLKN